jgi:hypothetical protein
MKDTEENLSLAEATAKRDILIARAAAGEAITKQQLRAADQAVRDAESDDRLNTAVGQHKRATAEREWIERHVATGGKLLEALEQAIATDIAAARDLDAAIDYARRVAAKKNETTAAMVEADRRLHDHNGLLEAAAQSNAVLAAIPKPEWPRLRTLSPHGLNGAAPLRAEIVQFKPGWQLERNGGDVVHSTTAEELARPFYGHMAPPVGEMAAA